MEAYNPRKHRQTTSYKETYKLWLDIQKLDTINIQNR